MLQARAERAQVLIVALGVLVVLSLMAMTFATLSRLELSATRNMDTAMHARLLAQAGLEYAIYTLRVDKYGREVAPSDGRDTIPYSDDAIAAGVTPDVVFGSGLNHYPGNDENFDSYWEEWMPGGGMFSRASTSTSQFRGEGVPGRIENDVDNDGYQGNDSIWLDMPFPLPDGQLAQVAILIKDFGASRFNVNYTWNNDADPTGPTAATATVGRYATDIPTLPSTGIEAVPGLAQFFVERLVTTRHGSDGYAWMQADNKVSSDFVCRNPQGDDRPFGALDAAELIYGTSVTSTLDADYIATVGGQVPTRTAQYLTPWSFDTLYAPYDTTALGGLKKCVNTLTASQLNSMRSAFAWWDDTVHGDASEWEQIAANLADYEDEDHDITQVGSSYGLEPHPVISELHFRNVNWQTWAGNYELELYNPFATTITAGAFTLTMDYKEPQVGGGTIDRQRVISVGQIAPMQFWTSIKSGASNAFWFNSFEATLTGQHGVIVDRAKQGNIKNCGSITIPSVPPGAAATDTTSATFQRQRYNIEESTNWDSQETRQNPPYSEGPAAQTIGAKNTNWSTNTIRWLTVANREIYSLGQLSDILKIGYDTTAPYTENTDWIAACKVRNDTNIEKVFFQPTKAAGDYSNDFWKFFESLTTEDPDSNGVDDDGDGAMDRATTVTATDTGAQANDIGGPELQIPGRININTASARVLAYLPAYRKADGSWKTLGEVTAGGATTLAQAIVNHREDITKGPFRGIGDIMQVTEIRNALGNDTNDNDLDGKTDDDAEKAMVFRSLANLITVRTNVYVVYVTARVIDDPNTDGIDNDGDTNIDEAGEADKVFGRGGFPGIARDSVDNDGDGSTDEPGEADDCITIVSRQKLVAVVDRSTNPITVRFFRWANDF